MKRTTAALAFLACAYTVLAQTPNGIVAGVVYDPSGATIAGGSVKVSGWTDGYSRTALTSRQGDFSFPALPPGEYEVSVEARGFQNTVRIAQVEAGTSTTVNFTMQVGNTTDSVTVEGASPQIHYDSNTVGGLVTQTEIAGLPLNGRSFLELSKLEPGVQAPTRATNNRSFVPVLGAPSSTHGQRVTVDGGSIVAIGYGGSAMGFSQEVVQEFQTSTVNFDLSTGITAAGAINVVTRSGGNDLHGTGFYFFRDHNLAAYPALNRDPVSPDPFFQRRQFGFALGGPIRRNRVFFFANWERNEQRGVVDTTLVTPDFARFSRVTTSPLFGNQFSVRLDARISNAHTLFLRHSHDGSRAFGPSLLQGGAPNAYPSSWSRQLAWVDQSILGLTSVLRPTLVNDLRFSYLFSSSSETAPGEQECPGCLGTGAPGITIPQAGLTLGRSIFVFNLARQFQFSDTLSWQKNTHRFRFGINWEHHRGGNQVWQNEPAAITLFSPDQARQYNLPLPLSFRTFNDVLQLPLQSVTVAVGNPLVPQENGGLVRNWNTLRLYAQDTWRLRRGLTLNYGFGWNVDRNLNYDLRKPAYLAPILGPDGLGPTAKRWTDFTPALGFAWAPSEDGKTVIRAGAGLFYDFLTSPPLDPERALLGPPALGRQTFTGTSIVNCLPGIPGVPVGSALNFPNTPTRFTGGNLLTCLPGIRDGLTQNLASVGGAVQGIQVSKSGALNPADLPTASALNANVGIQRELTRDFVLTADFAYRHFTHLTINPDLNHFNRAGGPVIPRCSSAQRSDPLVMCSNGAINVQENAGLATYKGLLLRAEKRFSHRFQLLGSWAYSSNTGTGGMGAGTGFNSDDWLQNYGPLTTDLTHIVNVASVIQLPRRFELGLNFSYLSAPPFAAYVGAIDFNGDGTSSDLLPGTTVNAFNRGMGRADLERLVTAFNASYAGTRDSQGAAIKRLTLPNQFEFGDHFHALDLRLTRSFVFRERWRLSLIGEVFNLYNNANLAGYSGDLSSAAFGQPTNRATQVFGSGGPRAFQLATRISF